MRAERHLGVDAADFRLWVCLHEETHRVQFGAVPWLRDHLLGEIHDFLGSPATEPAPVASSGWRRSSARSARR